jgi:hypothetical protein
MAKKTITIDRAPVLTLWATIVAEWLGFDAHEALRLGKAVAGLTAQSKGRHLGIFQPPKLAPGEKPKKRGLGEELWMELCGRSIPAITTGDGIRAVVTDKPIQPDQVAAYLERQFGKDLRACRVAMEQLARSRKPEALAGEAFALYERFRPPVPAGQRGWGKKGELDLEKIESLAKSLGCSGCRRG